MCNETDRVKPLWCRLIHIVSLVRPQGDRREEPGGLQAEHHESVRRREALPRRARNRPVPGANRLIPFSLSLFLFISSACPPSSPVTTPTFSCLAEHIPGACARHPPLTPNDHLRMNAKCTVRTRQPFPLAPMSQTVFFCFVTSWSWPWNCPKRSAFHLCSSTLMSSTVSDLNPVHAVPELKLLTKIPAPMVHKTSSLPAFPSPEPWPWPHWCSPFLCCFNFALDTIYINGTADSCVWIEFRVCDWNGICLFIHFFWSSSSWYAFYF